MVSNWPQKNPPPNKYNIHQIQVLSAIGARETKEEILIMWGRNDAGVGWGGKWEGKERCLISNINVSEAKNIVLTQA